MPGLAGVGDDTHAAVGEDPLVYSEPGWAIWEGERLDRGNGDEEQGGMPEPVYFF